jgi:hypothetical protein
MQSSAAPNGERASANEHRAVRKTRTIRERQLSASGPVWTLAGGIGHPPVVGQAELPLVLLVNEAGWLQAD